MTGRLRGVEAPIVLLFALGALLFSTVLAGSGLYALRADKLNGPVTLVSETEELADALADAPWIGGEAGGAPIWVVAPVTCGGCEGLFANEIPGQRDSGLDVRLILVASGTKPDAADAFLAALAKSRDWQAFDAWAQAKEKSAYYNDMASIGPLATPEEIEGYLEWGRASAARVRSVLERNEAPNSPALLIWRSGPEWRVAPATARAFTRARRDLSFQG